MGIRDVFKKVTKRVKKSVDDVESGEGENVAEDLFGAGAQGAEEPFPPEEEFEKELPSKKEEDFPPFEEEEEKPKKGNAARKEEEPEESFSSPAQSQGDLKSQIDIIRSKLDLLETHLHSIESKEDMRKFEGDRYVQYLTFINEKLDHLERELVEVERLIKKKR